MSNVVRLEEKFVVAIRNLLGRAGNDLLLTKNVLDKPAFNVNMVILAQEVIKRYLNPAIPTIKEVQKNLEQLRRYNVARKQTDSMSDLMSELADDLLIDVVIAKKNLEEIRLRSNAPVLAQVVIKKKLLPALDKIDELQKLLEYPEMRISKKRSA
ncbi:hypothetical protein HY494_00735 [Candidatus Woesearchaeota archaeon]|nr:hypothetical protein [Candidatus Woesearchaeota archaeon]